MPTMIETIKATIERKKAYEAEKVYISERFNDKRFRPSPIEKKRLEEICSRLLCIQIWLSLLQEDEIYVIQRHLIDGIDIPRITEEYRMRWGMNMQRPKEQLKHIREEPWKK